MKKENQEVMEIKRKRLPFTMVENSIIQDKNISKHAVMVYLVLCMHADKNGEDSYPGLKTIEKESRSGHTTVIDAIKELVDAGYVTKERRKNPNKPDEYLSNLYTIMGKRKEGTPNQEGGTPNQDDGVLPDETGNNIPSSNINPINNNKTAAVEFRSQKNGDITFTWSEVQKLCSETGEGKEFIVEKLELALKKADTGDKIKNIKGWSIAAVKSGWNLDEKEQPGDAESEYLESKERNEREARKTDMSLREAVVKGDCKEANEFFAVLGNLMDKPGIDESQAAALLPRVRRRNWLPF